MITDEQIASMSAEEIRDWIQTKEFQHWSSSRTPGEYNALYRRVFLSKSWTPHDYRVLGLIPEIS